ncbi:MAG: 50S ribosomal protein L25 [Candidatus Peribacteria bacterium]|jgi:large subunit ribosomal protein L25|nr:50S ribosomal protein L25 [Candidatus Peribacteria bacterium]
MKLVVQKRDLLGKKVKNLRKSGLVPAVVYGKHKESQTISCLKNDLLKVYKTAGYTTPVELTGEIDQLVLIHSFQLNPVTDEIITADFLAVSRTEKVSASVPVVVIGESPLEKLNEGRVQLVKDTVEVEAFPQDLPHQIEIDASLLTTISDVIFVKDLKVSNKVEVLDDGELPVVTIALLSDEGEEEETPTETTTDDVTVSPDTEANKSEEAK